MARGNSSKLGSPRTNAVARIHKDDPDGTVQAAASTPRGTRTARRAALVWLSAVLAMLLGLCLQPTAALGQCNAIPSHDLCEMDTCDTYPIGGWTAYYCVVAESISSGNPFGNTDRDAMGGTNADDIKVFIWQVLDCAPPGWFNNPDNIIRSVCWFHSYTSLTCKDALHALREIFQVLYCRDPDGQELRNLLFCLSGCDCAVQAAAGDEPCYFVPDDDSCDLDGDMTTDCYDLSIFLARSEVCCGEGYFPFIYPDYFERVARRACIWFTSSPCSSDAPDKPPCSDIYACITQYLGHPLDDESRALLRTCTGCTTPDCEQVGETGCLYKPSDFECDVNWDGMVDCDDLRIFIEFANDCQIAQCEAELTKDEKLALICEFLSMCEGAFGFDPCGPIFRCARAILGSPLTKAQREALLICSYCGVPSTDSPPPSPTLPPGERRRSHRDSGGWNGWRPPHGPNSPPEPRIPNSGSPDFPVAGPATPGEETPGEPEGEDSGGCWGDMMVASWPVSLFDGTKSERAIDLSVSLPGADFVLSREYNSDPNYAGASLAGNRWMMNAFRFLDIPADPDTDPIVLYGPPMYYQIEFSKVSGSPSTWKSGGPSTWYIRQETCTIGSTSYNIWRLTEPGGYEIDFFRSGTAPSGMTSAQVEGLQLQRRDVSGNKQTYEYSLYGGTSSVARLESIYLNGTDDSDSAAIVQFLWHTSTVDSDLYGKLDNARVLRQNASSAWIETDRVDYTYHTGAADHLGSAGDLVEVVRSTAVEGAPVGEAMWKRVTQYRYYKNDLAGSNNDDRLNGFGDESQLKLVIEPAQVEYFAQQYSLANYLPASTALTTAAAQLMTLADSATAFTENMVTYTVMDLASKIVSYDPSSKRVVAEFIQSGCACSGAAQGTKVTFDYLGVSGSPTVKVTQLTYDGSITSGDDYSTAFQVTFYDMETYDGVPYVRTVAICDPTLSNKWIGQYLYEDGTSSTLAGRLRKIVYPSAYDGSYTLATSMAVATPPTISTTDGLVYGYEYNANNRLTELRVRNGDDGDVDDVSDFDLLVRASYPSADSSTERTYYPSMVEHFREASTTASTNQDEIDADGAQRVDQRRDRIQQPEHEQLRQREHQRRSLQRRRVPLHHL
ncbi:MAG: hypothetical protein AB7O77_15950 [Phycisphaerales bacterium]